MRYLVIVRFILLIIATLGLASCSVGMALYGKEDIDYPSLKVGLDREIVISKLGQPQTTTTNGNGIIDTYLIEHGNAPSFKRAAENAMWSIVTAGLAEIDLTKKEIKTGEEATISIKYDSDNKLKSFPILKNKSIVLTICSQPEGAYITNANNEEIGIACLSSPPIPLSSERDNCFSNPRGFTATWASGATTKSPVPLIICKDNTTITWEDIKAEYIYLQYDFKRPRDAPDIATDLDIAVRMQKQRQDRAIAEQQYRMQRVTQGLMLRGY